MAAGANTRLVEREDELDAVVRALAHPPALVVVEGEAGIGKTRLVREALARAPREGRQVLLGQAHPMRDPFPLGSILDALAHAPWPPVDRLSPVVGVLRSLLPERAEDLPPAPERLTDAHAERHRVVRAVVALLAALGPTILVLEDLHWVDDRTVELLGLLPAQVPELAVVTTYRPQDLRDNTALRTALARQDSAVLTRIELRPLSARGVSDLAADVLGTGRVPARTAAQLLRRTGGVPFILEEDVRLLHDRRQLVEHKGEWRSRAVDGQTVDDVPDAVADAVGERVARLSADAQAALNAVAVLGERSSEELVRAVAGLSVDAAAVALSEALESGLLDERDHLLDVRHALAREAIHRAIPGPQRRRLHLAAAEALESRAADTSLGRVAHHYREAGAQRAWARCAEAAARVAMSLGEDETAHYYLLAPLMAGAVAPERRVELTLLVGWIPPLWDDAALAATITLLDEAVRDPSITETELGQLLLLRGFCRRINPRDVPGGTDDLRRAAELLEALPTEQARVLATLAAPRGREPLARRRDYLRAAEEVARRCGDPEVLAHVAANRLWLETAVGDPGAWEGLTALPAPSDSRPINRQLLRGLENAADNAAGVGHYARAEELARRGLQISDDVHYERFVADFKGTLLRVRWWTGDVDRVLTDLDALELTDIVATLIRSEALLGQGAIAQARERFEDPLQMELAEVNSRGMRAGSLVMRLRLADGDVEGAATLAERMLEALAETQIWAPGAFVMPFAPLDLVASYLPAYRDGVAGRDAPLALAALSFADGRVAAQAGDDRAAVRHFGAARRAFATARDVRLAAHAASAEAEALARSGDHAGSVELFRRAAAQFDDVGGRWEADGVRAAMRAAGIRPPSRGGRRGYGVRLSPREVEVARLAAAGHTNREIAERLVLSPRTVDAHVANVLRKLGLSSRRELAGDARLR